MPCSCRQAAAVHFQGSRSGKRAENTLGITLVKQSRVSTIYIDAVDLTTPGGRIRDARRSIGFSMKDLAARVGLSATGLGYIERNVVPPKLRNVRTIARELKKPIHYIGCFENMPENTLGQKIKKARHYYGLTVVEASEVLSVNEKTFLNWELDNHIPFSYELSDIIHKFSKFTF